MNFDLIITMTINIASVVYNRHVYFLFVDELDSYMYQTVGHHAIDLYSKALELPLYRHTIQGTTILKDATYEETKGDEVEDLYQLLTKVMVKLIDIIVDWKVRYWCK